jgi:hypothetical protein
VSAQPVDETFAQVLVFVANTFGAESREAQQVREARAGVAALIEAADEGEVSRDGSGRVALFFNPAKAERLLAALARVGGAS